VTGTDSTSPREAARTTRRGLLAGGAALLALGACGRQPSKFRSYRGPAVTSVVALKGQRQLLLLNGQTALRSYAMQLGANPVGTKVMEGDGRTPEGPYWIDRRNPNSAYHLSVGISYPNEADLARAEAMGVRPGGDIFIHGTPREMARRPDWTAGCIAVTNDEVEEIYAMVRDGTPIFLYA
jgi:murein L,D-transpeptidase YafK